MSFTSFFDYTVNGLIIGNIYALLAVGLALIFGVSHLINFAHGSVYTVGAYIGWASITYLHTPLPVTIALVVLGSGALGMLIERVGLRPLQGAARIAPLLATIGISFVLDILVQLVFSPDPRSLPTQLPDWRLQIGTGTIGALGPAHCRHRHCQRGAAVRLPAFHETGLGRARHRARPRRRAADGRGRRPRQPERVRDRRRRWAASRACWWACTTTTSARR
jgi:hypothetical protein